MKWKASIPETLILLGTSILLIHPGVITDLIGIAIIAVLYVAHTAFSRRKAAGVN